jgi:hypothetical protein
MMALKLLPVLLSYLVLGAHFLREGNQILVAVSLVLPFLLFIPRTWSARLLQLGLILGAAEWVWTLVSIARARHMMGGPWSRMAIILGVVAAFTLLSTLVFRLKAARERYSG